MEIKLKENSMLTVAPELYDVWDFEKNNELGLDIYKMTKGMGKIAWWKCPNCKQSKPCRIQHKVNGTICPYCTNRETLKGFNDIWTTDPELASMLLNEEDGYKYTSNSNVKVDWKCNKCNSTIKNKCVYSVKYQGLYCPVCSDGFSLGEKIMYQLLNHLKIEFIYDSKQSWSNNKRYDFFLPNYNTIIEVHGEQHSKNSFSRIGGDTVEEVQANDKFKEELAIKNGIKNYIVIDATKSEYNYIINSIKDSVIMELLSIDSFDSFKLDIRNSLVIESWNLWNSGIKRTKEISDILKISQVTIRRYLKLGTSLGKCDYLV